MRTRLTKEEIQTWEMLFPMLVQFIRANPKAGDAEVIAAAVGSKQVTEIRVKEWLAQTVKALWDDGTLPAASVDGLLDHMRAVSELSLVSIAGRVVEYSRHNPMQFMLDRAESEIVEEIVRWKQEPDMVPNIEKEMQLERLREELAELD